MQHEIERIEEILKTIHLLRVEAVALPIPNFNNFKTNNYDDWDQWLTDCKESNNMTFNYIYEIVTNFVSTNQCYDFYCFLKNEIKHFQEIQTTARINY